MHHGFTCARRHYDKRCLDTLARFRSSEPGVGSTLRSARTVAAFHVLHSATANENHLHGRFVMALGRWVSVRNLRRTTDTEASAL